MKTYLRSLIPFTVCVTAISLLPSMVRAEEGETEKRGPYVRADLGGNVTCHTRLKEFFGPVAPGTRVTFDPGARFGVAAGYPVTDWFTPEGQMGILINNVESITGADEVNAVFSNVSFLLNARFHPAKRSRVSPYFGGGLGMSTSVLTADPIELNGVRLTGSESAAVFAYQAFGGIRFALNHRMGLSVEYRYFATTDPEWEADDSDGAFSDTMRFAGVQTHSLSMAFDISF